MPIIKNVSRNKICMRSGAVVEPGRSVYVPDIDDVEIASAIARGFFSTDLDTACPPVAKKPVDDAEGIIIEDSLPEKTPGKVVGAANGLDVYSPNDFSSDDYDFVDGVRVVREDTKTQSEHDENIFVDL